MNHPGNIAAAFDATSRRLALAGITGARLEARVLMSNVLGVEVAAVLAHMDANFSADDDQRLKLLVNRRANREPMAQILATREFWSLPFHVTKDTLIPRPDSETIIEAALAWASDRQDVSRVLDLGTGTGCLLLTLLHELPGTWGIGVDISAAALDVAQKNANSLGLDDRSCFVRANWADGIKATFDLIVVNPPYIPQADIASLAPEVSLFEPPIALSGGNDGLNCYRALVPQLSRLLSPWGRIFVEVGQGQASQVVKIIKRNNLQAIDVKNDLSKIRRCVIASWG